MMALVPVQVENRCHGYVELWMNCLLEQHKAAGGVIVRLPLSVPWVKQVCVLPDESARRERDTASRSRARARARALVSSVALFQSKSASFFLFSQFLSPLLSRRTRSLSFAMETITSRIHEKNKDIILWFLNSLTRSACSWSAGTLV